VHAAVRVAHYAITGVECGVAGCANLCLSGSSYAMLNAKWVWLFETYRGRLDRALSSIRCGGRPLRSDWRNGSCGIVT
jgi:hypothetical protein